MIIKIQGVPRELIIAAFHDFNLLDKIDALEQQEARQWSKVFDLIASGQHPIAYWDTEAVERPGFHSFMRYALHRSTRKADFLQLSVMEIRNGESIPTSHTDHDSVKGFLREVPNYAIVTIL